MLNNTAASALIYVNPSIISKYGVEAIQGAECGHAAFRRQFAVSSCPM